MGDATIGGVTGSQSANDAPTIIGGPTQTPESQSPTVGTQLGRYVVVGTVGVGGMGRVFRAYDAKLRREVALKLLRSQSDTEAEARIVREAQSMAQLTHPNVVAVYDVEVYEGRPFIAMEYVEGTTLKDWLRDDKPTWQEVLPIFLEAGRGLAAAHRAGIVHRDFKPSNVLLGGEDKRTVRVTDFGLASGVESLSTDGLGVPVAAPASETLTAAGAVMGTPAYMAPEQHAGLRVDERSDQYAFCVALWEGLCGKRPFRGDALVQAKLRPDLLEFPAGRKIPRFIKRAVMRGLSPKTHDRFASMDALLVDLERQPSRRARVAVVVGIGVVGVAGWIVADDVRREAARAACAGEAEVGPEAWNEAARGDVERAFEATGSAIAAQTFARVEPRLHAYAQQWAQLRTQSCIAAELQRGNATTDRLATACLDERLTSLEATVEAFRVANEETLSRAVSTAAGLPVLASCVDEAWLHKRVALPADEATRAEVLALRKELAEVSSKVRAGQYREAARKLPLTAQRADELGYAPLIAQARYSEGDLADLDGDLKRARQSLEAAFYTAGAAGADEAAADAAIFLTFVAGYRQAEYETGLMWGNIAQMLLARLGQGNDLWGANLQNNLAAIYTETGRLDEAAASHEQALNLRLLVFGADHPDIATSYNNIGHVQQRRNDFEAALVSYERAVAIYERVLGPHHPDITTPLSNIGVLKFNSREHEDALDYYSRVHEIYSVVYGEDHLRTSGALSDMGRVYYARGQFDVALGHHERVLEIVRSQTDDAEHEATILDDVGQTYARLGLFDEALTCHDKSLAIYLRLRGKKHRSTGFTSMLIGRTYLERGAPSAALPWLERALAIYEDQDDIEPGAIAGIQFALAQALWYRPSDRIRAYELARTAIADYKKAGPASDIWRAEVQAWLDDPEL